MLIPQLRPAARGVLKAGMALSDKLREAFMEAREQWGDLAAEARTEMKEAEKHAAASEAEAEPPRKTAAKRTSAHRSTTPRRTPKKAA